MKARRARVYFEGHLSSHRWRYEVPFLNTTFAGMHGGEQTWRAAFDRACAVIRADAAAQQVGRVLS